MMSKIKDTFKTSEALGELATMPAMQTLNEKEKPKDKKIASTPDEFRTALWEAQFDGTGTVEVTDELYHFIIKNNPTESFTYGNPGVRVFKQGTKDVILNKERKPAY